MSEKVASSVWASWRQARASFFSPQSLPNFELVLTEKQGKKKKKKKKKERKKERGG